MNIKKTSIWLNLVMSSSYWEVGQEYSRVYEWLFLGTYNAFLFCFSISSPGMESNCLPKWIQVINCSNGGLECSLQFCLQPGGQMASGAVLPFCSFQLVPLGMTLLWRGRAAQQYSSCEGVLSLTHMSLSDDLNRYADPLWGATINSMLEFWWQFLLTMKLFSVFYF